MFIIILWKAKKQENMKKIIFALLTIVFGFGWLFAQEKADTTKIWSTGGVLSTTFSQVSLTNWSEGGQNSISGNALVNLFANYKKDRSAWDNTLDLAYGMAKQGEEGVIKSDDKIDFASKYGYKASKKWYYTAMISFKSQFADGYDYPNDSVVISRLMAPGYIIGSIGMDYKPNDNFTVFVSPVTGKITIVNDETLADAGAFGVEPAEIDTATGNITTHGKKMRTEFGGYLKVMFKKKIMKNVDIQTKLDLFSNYMENPQNIDVNWEVLISMKINKYLSANIMTHLKYDDDVDIAVDEDGDGEPEKFGPRTQFKEVFGVGFSYKF